MQAKMRCSKPLRLEGRGRRRRRVAVWRRSTGLLAGAMETCTVLIERLQVCALVGALPKGERRKREQGRG